MPLIPQCSRLIVTVGVLHSGFGCHALASPSSQIRQPISTFIKVISRKGDGRYKVFTIDSAAVNDNVVDDVSTISSSGHARTTSSSSKLEHIQSILRSTFLPTTPSSSNGQCNQWETLLAHGYISYVLYDLVQDLSTNLRSVLATQRVLEGVGVGRSSATALSATLNFLIRDGCGMIASLLFSSYFASSFRRNVKRWKYFADVMVDIGITLEMLAPSVLGGTWFLPLLCMGNVCKALCGVAAGACGGSLQLYWANKLMGTEEGIAEIAAKGGAQRTVLGGVGLVLSGLFAKWLGDGTGTSVGGIQKRRLWISMYCLLTMLHLISNWMSLKLIALDWLNGWRLHWVVEEFLKCIDDGKDTICISDPMEMSTKEPIFFLPELQEKKRRSSKYPIHMGVSFDQFATLSHQPLSVLQSKLEIQQNQCIDNYIITVGHQNLTPKTKRCILVAFFPSSSNKERAKAYLHGCLLGRALVSLSAENNHASVDDNSELICRAESIAEEELRRLWPIFETSVAKAGWKLDKTECTTDGYEIYIE